MTKKNDTAFFESKLLDFVTAKNPMMEMIQWVMDKFMEIEVAHKTGAEKGIRAESRTGYRCGYRIRRFDTRLGTVYLSVPKTRVAHCRNSTAAWEFTLYPTAMTAFRP